MTAPNAQTPSPAAPAPPATAGVPLLDLTAQTEALWDQLKAASENVIRSGRYINGPNCQQLEAELAAFLGVKYVIGVSSGTDALVIALRALGVDRGDEVITTPFTFIASAEAASIIGATPVFVDVEPETMNLDPKALKRAITSRTRAIVPVHLFGHAADMDAILDIAREHNLVVLEDTAQAFGGFYRDRALGTLGQAGAYSTFPTKNLGGFGDGGFISTDLDDVAVLARKLREHGSAVRYQNEIVGYNGRLDELQAALLRVKLPHVNAWNQRRREVAQYYNDGLKATPGIRVPVTRDYATHVFHQYTLQITNGKRDALQAFLTARNVGCACYYPKPAHRLPVYEHYNIALEVSDTLANQVLSLPIWPEITTQQQDIVIQTIQQGMRSV